MRHEQRGTGLRRALMACLCGGLIVLPVASFAQQAQDDEDTFEQKIIKNILGGMGVDVGRPGIDYRERSPLVIPPSLDLPPPQAAGAALQSPGWPRDPERVKSAAPRNTRNVRATSIEPGTESALTPDELRRGINPRAPRVTDPSQSAGSLEQYNVGRQSSPQELGSKSIFTWDGLMGTHLKDEAKFDREPTRSSLTQPPVGYQTPSPSQPYGTGKDSSGGWKIPTILDRAVGRE